MNMEDLETMIALQCAPLILGVKMSNLLIVTKKQKDVVERMFWNTTISNYLVCESPDDAIIKSCKNLGKQLLEA